MDRTRIALDKARQKRVGGQPVFAVSPLPRNDPRPASIRYQQTQVVKLDPRTLRSNHVVADLEDDPIAHQYRLLRTQVLKRMTKEGLSTLAVCSAMPGEGKTLTAINLAFSLSMDVNQTVLLVDLDLRKPSVAQSLGLKPEFGIDDFLSQGTDLQQCLINPGTERLVVLPARAPLEKSSEVLASPQMAKLAHELKNRYPDRIVVYDLPPVLPTDDCLAFLPNVDAVLFVVGEGGARVPDIERALGLLRDAHVIGTMLNASKQRKFNVYQYQ